MTILVTVLIGSVVVAVVVLLQNSNKPNDSQLVELQRTVRLLVEQQSNNRRPEKPEKSGGLTLHTEYSPQSSVAVPTSPPALSLAPPESRTPMAMTSPSMGAAVPVEVVAGLTTLQNSVKELERRNRELSRQLTLTEVSNVVETEKRWDIQGNTGNPSVKLTPSEVETIRAIFNLFDTAQTGVISTKEVKALHEKLGEKLTDEEADAVIRDLDSEGTGAVNFNQFLYWWYENHKRGKKGSRYTQRFKLISAKLSTEQFDTSRVITQDSGTPYTLEYRLNFYYKQPNSSLKQISPWHDVPLYRVGAGSGGQLYNMVCEIPKWTRAKFECSTGEPYNPIKQDTQHGKLRYYKHGDIMFNYGFMPQTWEDPAYIPTDTGCPGDNDPIDILEIGARQLRTGEILAVKILGVLALIDDGETDWKLIGISISDRMAADLNDIDDVETHLPGAIKSIREYFRDYKSFSGKINTYALRAQAMPRQYAVNVIEDTHKHWKTLHFVNKKDVISKGGSSVAGNGVLQQNGANENGGGIVEGGPVQTVTETPADKVKADHHANIPTNGIPTQASS